MKCSCSDGPIAFISHNMCSLAEQAGNVQPFILLGKAGDVAIEASLHSAVCVLWTACSKGQSPYTCEQSEEL